VNAYDDAPDVLSEMNAVLRLTERLRRPGGRTPEAVREQRLRKAALLDRIALYEVATYSPEVAASAVVAARDAAQAVAAYDRQHGTAAGPDGPDSRIWAGSYRPYVRQEYAAWRRAHT
jgi:hypothetical protein